ncbi:MAG TPA: AraC family transcriptional regulator [Bacteroidia bacterium]|nr:AraC family transcriptional regulator [Bacteroidia bacterium]
MTTKLCPYCNSAKSVLMGNVYCSHSSDDMPKLDNGSLMIKADELEETADHVSRLTIRLSLNGDQYYKVGSNDHVIDPKSYLVINQGQHYRTAFEGTKDQEMILAAFKPSFVSNILKSIVTTEDRLLDDPFKATEQPISFFEKSYEMDPEILNMFLQLRKLMDEEDLGWKKEFDLQSIYSSLLIRLLFVHKNLKQDIDKLKSAKLSTRTELYRRLTIARDYMDAHPEKRISIEDVATVAFLSPHHFKRAFKELFNITPHQYHIEKRLSYSRELLADQSSKVEDVCRKVGFENSSSFIRLFREHYGCTPRAYHLNNF